MPGAHTFVQYTLTYKFYTKPWPRINGLCRKKVRVKTGTRAATAARVAAANRTVLATCDDPGAHGNEQGQSKLERGQMMRAVGMAGKEWQAHSPQNKTTAGGHSRRTLRPAQASQQTATVGRPRSKNNSCHKVGLPLAVQCRSVGGVQWCWQPGRRVQTYLTCPYPTYRLCLSLSLPTPLI